MFTFVYKILLTINAMSSVSRKKYEVIALNVPLKRSFCFKGPEKSVLLSGRPTYPGSQLSEVFLLEKGKQVQGTGKICTT